MVTIHTSDDVLRVLRENPEWKAEVRREILTEELLSLPARFDQFVAKTDQFIDEQRQFNARIDDFVVRTDRRFARLEGDISDMKDDFGISRVAKDVEGIAHDMGYKFIRTLSSSDLFALVTSNDTSDLQTGDLRSFRVADLVIEANDENGAIHYIAMEVSFAADERDTRRAIRNAGFLARFTGRPAYAAIASMRNDYRIQDVIDSGQVYWHRLDNREPRSE